MPNNRNGIATPEMAERGTAPVSVVQSQRVDSTVMPVETGGADIALSAGHRPEWIRLPRTGTHCAYTGLTRSAMNSLILPSGDRAASHLVRSVCLRKKGRATGVRLVHLQSLLDYIAHEARNQPVVVPRNNKMKKGEGK